MDGVSLTIRQQLLNSQRQENKGNVSLLNITHAAWDRTGERDATQQKGPLQKLVTPFKSSWIRLTQKAFRFSHRSHCTSHQMRCHDSHRAEASLLQTSNKMLPDVIARVPVNGTWCSSVKRDTSEKVSLQSSLMGKLFISSSADLLTNHSVFESCRMGVFAR